MDVETVPIMSGVVDSPPNRLPSNTFVSWQRAITFPAAPSERCSPHRLRSAGTSERSQLARHAERISTGLRNRALGLLFTFCFKVSSCVSQEPFSSASFWCYPHFLVQSAQFFFACGGQEHSSSFFIH